MDELYMSGYDWAERYGFRVADPTGWRYPHLFELSTADGSWETRYASMLDHISERVFWLRVSVSIVEGMSIKAAEKLWEMVGEYNPGQRLDIRLTRPESLTERISQLLSKWERDLLTYPVEASSQALYAHMTLQLCIEELSETL